MTLVLCAIAGLGAAQASEERTWTDVDGRTMQAEILGVEDGKVRVIIRGRESAVPLERLSAADVEFAEQWQEQRKEQEELRKAQATMFDGRQLETGGKRNLFEFEYDEEYRASLVDKSGGQIRRSRHGLADCDRGAGGFRFNAASESFHPGQCAEQPGAVTAGQRECLQQLMGVE